MIRYYDYMVIEFVNGLQREIGGNHAQVFGDVLTVWTDGSYGQIKDKQSFPLANILSYKWKDDA